MDNNFQRLNDIEEVEIYPGFLAKLIHTPHVTLSYVRCLKGSVLPVHHHSEDQVLNLLQGEMEVTMGHSPGKTIRAGEVVVIPSEMPHTVTSLTDCLALDIFIPVRKDYLPFGIRVK